MKTLTRLSLIASATVAVSSHFALANINDYRLIAFDDCDVVAEHALNQQQTETYLALQHAEEKMDKLEKPIEQLQQTLDKYTSQIGNLSSAAIQTDGDKVTIDHSLLRQQEALSEKLNTLLAAHKGDFESLEQQARRIEASARHFEKILSPLLTDTRYDQVRVVGPEDESNTAYDCNQGHTLVMM